MRLPSAGSSVKSDPSILRAPRPGPTPALPRLDGLYLLHLFLYPHPRHHKLTVAVIGRRRRRRRFIVARREVRFVESVHREQVPGHQGGLGRSQPSVVAVGCVEAEGEGGGFAAAGGGAGAGLPLAVRRRRLPRPAVAAVAIEIAAAVGNHAQIKIKHPLSLHLAGISSAQNQNRQRRSGDQNRALGA